MSRPSRLDTGNTKTHPVSQELRCPTRLTGDGSPYPRCRATAKFTAPGRDGEIRFNQSPGSATPATAWKRAHANVREKIVSAMTHSTKQMNTKTYTARQLRNPGTPGFSSAEGDSRGGRFIFRGKQGSQRVGRHRERRRATDGRTRDPCKRNCPSRISRRATHLSTVPRRRRCRRAAA